MSQPVRVCMTKVEKCFSIRNTRGILLRTKFAKTNYFLMITIRMRCINHTKGIAFQ